MKCLHCQSIHDRPRVTRDVDGRWWATWIHVGWEDATCVGDWRQAIDHAEWLWWTGSARQTTAIQ